MAGFLTLAEVYPLICLLPGGKGMNLTQWVLEGYYIFFTLFMAAAVVKLRLIIFYCGFLRHKLYKSLFYIL